MLLTTQQFMRLGGESWDRSFTIRVGKRARAIHEELLGREPKKVRPSVRGAYRNKVGLYPCGVLEQAYRQVRAEDLERGGISIACPEDSETEVRNEAG
ncbi:hypothetical protein CIW48_08125 [Methylobacterium sp. P1-11]|uniref:hypothetical protein n=1 Tax=Methylobacterium sp. P1-11 TaxID=2024616 RepID=UPI0011EE1C9E|nr:hypothetical protein [Methylobacterium sp. P1-11]KAA0124285.1 hypothetical protein CIW48_08125 [Methylobacterium sp. P1-11]